MTTKVIDIGIRSAHRITCENLANGDYAIIKEHRLLPDEIACYLLVDDGKLLFTSHRNNHAFSPTTNFKHAYGVDIQDGFYRYVYKSVLSLWMVHDEQEQHDIIDYIESLVLNHVVRLADNI